MPTGDARTDFALVVGAALTCGVTAYVTTDRRRAAVLWALAVISVIVAALIWFRPGSWDLALVFDVGLALLPPAIVGGAALIVAQLRTEVRALAVPAGGSRRPEIVIEPRNPAEATVKSGWAPDISLTDAALYLAQDSRWVAGRVRTNMGEVRDEIRTALQRGKVTAWARYHPKKPEFQVSASAWNTADVDINESYAFSPAVSAALYDVRMSQAEIEKAWPRKAD